MTKSTHIFAVDIGNTRMKWALFKVADAAFFERFSAKNLTVFDRHMQLQSLIVSYGNCLHADLATHNLPNEALAETTQVAVSNVASEAVLSAVITKLTPQTNISLFTSETFSCGIQNHYDNPQQLGADRWAAIIAAKYLQQSDCVVVNAGTAVTIDVLQMDSSNTADEILNGFNSTNEKLNHFSQTQKETNAHFLGGLILLGLRLMQTSLHQNTAMLYAKSNALDNTQANDFIAQNTHNAISQGAITAVCSSILYIAEQVKQQTNHMPVIILSGGDGAKIVQYLTKMLESHKHAHTQPTQSLSNIPFMIEHLVLFGLFISTTSKLKSIT